MTFNEANTVEAFIRDLLCGGVTHHTTVGPGLARTNNQLSGLGWHYLSHQNTLNILITVSRCDMDMVIRYVNDISRIGVYVMEQDHCPYTYEY